MVHCIKMLVVEDSLESLDEGGEAEREEKDEGADGADHLQVGKGDNNVVVEVLHLHPAPPKSVPQAGLATLASGQVAPLRPRDQGHQQREQPGQVRGGRWPGVRDGLQDHVLAAGDAQVQGVHGQHRTKCKKFL